MSVNSVTFGKLEIALIVVPDVNGGAVNKISIFPSLYLPYFLDFLEKK